MTILDRYFELSDTAGKDENDFLELTSLFAEDAVLAPAGAAEVRGRAALAVFFRTFYSRNTALRHVWRTGQQGVDLVAEWAVAGERHNGELFILRGTDRAQLDGDGKIARLSVAFIPSAPSGIGGEDSMNAT